MQTVIVSKFKLGNLTNFEVMKFRANCGTLIMSKVATFHLGQRLQHLIVEGTLPTKQTFKADDDRMESYNFFKNIISLSDLIMII